MKMAGFEPECVACGVFRRYYTDDCRTSKNNRMRRDYWPIKGAWRAAFSVAIVLGQSKKSGGKRPVLADTFSFFDRPSTDDCRTRTILIINHARGSYHMISEQSDYIRSSVVAKNAGKKKIRSETATGTYRLTVQS
jgi:hypothetical protein